MRLVKKLAKNGQSSNSSLQEQGLLLFPEADLKPKGRWVQLGMEWGASHMCRQKRQGRMKWVWGAQCGMGGLRPRRVRNRMCLWYT